MKDLNKAHNNINIQPPPSVPREAEHNPQATIAAGPDDDPPVYLSSACGFPVVLQEGKTSLRHHIQTINGFFLLF